MVFVSWTKQILLQISKMQKYVFGIEKYIIRQLEQYVDLYIGNKKAALRVHEQYDERWEYVVCLSPSEEFQQVSFVNGICTTKGGKHVDHIVTQLTRKLQEYIEKKKNYRTL